MKSDKNYVCSSQISDNLLFIFLLSLLSLSLVLSRSVRRVYVQERKTDMEIFSLHCSVIKILFSKPLFLDKETDRYCYDRQQFFVFNGAQGECCNEEDIKCLCSFKRGANLNAVGLCGLACQNWELTISLKNGVLFNRNTSGKTGDNRCSIETKAQAN